MIVGSLAACTGNPAAAPRPTARPVSTSARPLTAAPTPSLAKQRNKVVVLDPGHSAGRDAVTDPSTGLTDRYYPNYPELNDVFAVALLVKAKLERRGGFTVLLTKRTAGQNATYRQRAEVGNRAHADLGVSIHDQAGLPSQGGLPFATANNEIYYQAVGMSARPRGSGKRTRFTDRRVAKLSRRYAKIFVQQRTDAEQHRVRVAYGHPDPRDANDSDIWLVQLFAKMPWIYSEAGGFSPDSTSCGRDGNGRRLSDGACLSTADRERYATGIANSILAALA